MVAPPLPWVTPSTADPSVQAQVAYLGSVARISSAEARRTPSGASRLAPGPACRELTIPSWCAHGGRVVWRRSSTLLLAAPASVLAGTAFSSSVWISCRPRLSCYRSSAFMRSDCTSWLT